MSTHLKAVHERSVGIGASATQAAHQGEVCAACPARSRGFCSSHDDETLAHFALGSARVALSRGETLETNDFAIMAEGVLNAVHYGQDGKHRIVGITMLGEAMMPGELSENVIAVAATPVVVCRIRSARYQEALNRSQDFRRHIYLQARAKRDRARHLAFAIGHLSPEQRISAFFASCTGFMPWQPLPDGGGILTMEYERQDIAALLSTTVETVCRVLRRLEGSGVIRMRDPRRIEIRNLADLQVHGGLSSPLDGEGFAPAARQFPVHAKAMRTVNAADAIGR